ncbi:hypothetical protein [Streptomyces sp. NBC_00096]|uniref:hypothetical protein n=1 Tax=Streptomyces sp. NBC_00096 TaxID=2975650 RepID=UPI00386CAF78
MTRSITNPAELHDPTGYGYGHVVSAPGEQVFIAGQYGSDGTGHGGAGGLRAVIRRAPGG